MMPMTKKSTTEIVPPTDEEIARFMTHGRSIKEIAEWADCPQQLVSGWIKEGLKGFEGYDIFAGPKNIVDEQTYVAVPSAGLKRPKDIEKAWKWNQSSGQPYGMVTFPENFNHRKIRIIPLDGILFGDPAHDADRFNDVVKRIAREPNTFCFLNGDIIAEIGKASRGMREQLLLDLSVAFQNKMLPIAHKILWAQQGCLEARSLGGQGFDPLAHFCSKLNIPYFTEPIYIDLFWGKQLFTIWAMHGHSTAQTKGARMNALRKPAQMHEHTHFIIGGHIGDTMWNRTIKICRNPVAGKLVPKEEFHITLGNFKKYLGTRSARRGEAPSSTHAVVMYLYPNGEHHCKTDHEQQS